MQVGQAEGVEITVRGAMMSPASTKMEADKGGVSARRWDIMGIMHNEKGSETPVHDGRC